MEESDNNRFSNNNQFSHDDSYNTNNIQVKIKHKYCLGYRKAPNDIQLSKVKRLIRALSEKHTKLLVCRLDLNAFENCQPHFNLWLKAVKKKFNSDFYGYIASLEFSKSKGWHYHLLLILNGSTLIYPTKHMKTMLDMWSERTGKSGWIPTYNEKKGKVRSTGMLKRGCTEDFNRVIYGASYLCKASQKPDSSLRLFNMTQIKSVTDKKNFRKAA